MTRRRGVTYLNRRGLTVIEVLVSMALFSILVALLLPAVQSIRESARQAECRNHLRQIGIAAQNHESNFGHFPTNGWGYLWQGEMERGADEKQPGGWIFNLLPFIESGNIHNLDHGEATEAERSQRRTDRMATSIAAFRCPSRPAPLTGPANPNLVPWNAHWSPSVAKTDYAINEGSWISDTGPGPESLSEGDSDSYVWKDMRRANGVSFQRSRVRVAHVADGLSNTILAGEKYVNRLSYSTADDPGYDQSMYGGVDLDLNRWTTETPIQDAASDAVRRFGSAHQNGCFFVYSDGSVRQITYRIDRRIFRDMGVRNNIRTNDSLLH